MANWLRFKRPWDWRQSVKVTIAYEAKDYPVPIACVRAALKAGVAVRIARKNKDEPFTEVHDDECGKA